MNNKIMEQQQSSYRGIMKATSLFGGVQFFQILIQIIRSKFVAILLGPTGMGIMGLLTSTTGLISNLTNFGLSVSAVRDISTANSTGDLVRISLISKVLRRLVWATGILGAFTTLILSHWLSFLTFGNYNYTYSFAAISITLLLTQINAGQLVILQGMRKLNYLAQSNVFGSLMGLIIVIPFYYLWGIDGIVPVILGLSIVSLILSTYYSQKIKLNNIPISIGQTLSEGQNMLKMGFVINLSSIFSVGTAYIVRVYIGKVGSVADVGLYTAGFSIINTYVSMIFNAMGTDFYPRLSAVSHSNTLCRTTINQQAEIAILIIAPVLVTFIVLIKWVILVLYSNKFLGIDTFLYWSALGMLFKTASWCIGFIFLAKAKGKIFFWSELAANIYIC